MGNGRELIGNFAKLAIAATHPEISQHFLVVWSDPSVIYNFECMLSLICLTPPETYIINHLCL